MSQELIINDCDWCDQAQEMLAAAVPNASVLDIKQQVDDEGAQLFSVSRDGVIIGYYVLRVDYLVEHCEGVIIAATAYGKDIDLTVEVLPSIEQQFKGCKFIRIHTARAGLVKKLAASGYMPLEFVMIKGL